MRKINENDAKNITEQKFGNSKNVTKDLLSRVSDKKPFFQSRSYNVDKR